MFIEERLPFCVLYGSSWGDDFAVEIVTTASNKEYRHLIHPYPMRRFTVSYMKNRESEQWADLLNMYHKAFGRFAGFRVQAIDDFSTAADHVGAPSATDQPLALVSEGVYQLQKYYGTLGPQLGIKPVRTIYKPWPTTGLLAIGGVPSPAFTITENAETGRLTLSPNKTFAITGITKAASAVVTVGAHTLVAGETVHFSSVAGMTQINGRRGTITTVGGTTITVNINTLSFGTYSGSGNVNTRPQSGEAVTGGCLFDLPCRFDSVLDLTPVSPGLTETGQIDIVELIAL